MKKESVRKEGWDEWERPVQTSQTRFTKVSTELQEKLNETGAIGMITLPEVNGLDATVFEVIKSFKLPLELPSAIKYDLKRRLMYVGTTLMRMHNCLCQPGEYECLAPILRKCFNRVKYILSDATKNETKLDEPETST